MSFASSLKHLFVQTAFLGLPFLALGTSCFTVANSTKTVIDLSRIQESGRTFDLTNTLLNNRHGTLGHLDDFSEYLQNLTKLNAGLKKEKTDPNRFKSVFYPLLGTDIVLPLILFPQVKTIITMDRTPFVKAGTASDTSPILIQPALGDEEPMS